MNDEKNVVNLSIQAFRRSEFSVLYRSWTVVGNMTAQRCCLFMTNR